jgi:hypothetical protein
MKSLVPFLVILVLSSCAANSRGGYHRLPPLENRLSKDMYWKNQRAQTDIQKNKNTIAAYSPAAPATTN